MMAVASSNRKHQFILSQPVVQDASQRVTMATPVLLSRAAQFQKLICEAFPAAERRTSDVIIIISLWAEREDVGGASGTNQ